MVILELKLDLSQSFVGTNGHQAVLEREITNDVNILFDIWTVKSHEETSYYVRFLMWIRG